MICKTIKISRSSYYRRLNKISFEQKHKELIIKIKEIFHSSKSRYGYIRVTRQLKKEGINCSKHLVYKLMKINNLSGLRKPRRFRTKDKSTTLSGVCPNVLKGRFNPDEISLFWSSDITYIRTLEGFLYLCVIMDLCSKKIVGWQTSDNIDESLVIETLFNALKNPSVTVRKNQIFHSDRGVQYRAKAFTEYLSTYQFTQSMSAKGYCYDNAPLEAFFSTLKRELIYRTKFKTREEAARAIFEYIEVFYNRQRLHSTIGYLTPVEYEKIKYEKLKNDNIVTKNRNIFINNLKLNTQNHT